MKKFKTMGELIAYLVGANAPNELKAEASTKSRVYNNPNKNKKQYKTPDSRRFLR